MHSYQNIKALLGFEKELPVTKEWSAAPDFLRLISDFCLENNPDVIVECSSGTSSLVLSRCCQLNQHGHVFSLENAEQFAAKSWQQLNDFSLSDYIDIIHAPLREVTVNNGGFQWYALDELPAVKIDLLVIDGPPGFLQKHSRYPALPLLYELLSNHCCIFLDDAAREDEQALAARWLQAYPEFQAEYIDNERGCYIFKR